MVDKINKIFNNKYSMALFVIGILWIIAVVIGFSYALWEMNHTQSGSNNLATSCFEINFVETSESINLANAAPLSDEKGLRTVPYEFKVVNKCDQFYNYEITLDIIDANTTLDLSKVKVTLDGADTLTPTILNTLPTAIEEESIVRTSYILGSGELDYQEEKTYQLRLWLDETSTQTEMNKLFEGRVTIKNVQAVKSYRETALNGATPTLAAGLIPVTFEADGTVKVADIQTEWYNYTNKEWANAVTVDPSFTTLDAGTTIPMTSIKQMYVWIPRYEYKFAENATAAVAIDINYIDKNVTTPTSGYIIHPAFTVESENLNGMWIGKFEQGFDNTIKPDQNSRNNITISTSFTEIAAQKNQNGLDSTSDIHMIKNTEWGAVTYFSQSIYGVCTNATTCSKVENNNYYNTTTQDIITGCGGVDTPVENVVCPETNRWTTQAGQNASTTRNITGIYDMAGGRWEQVMGNMRDASNNFYPSNTGFTSAPPTKYYDSYAYSENYFDHTRGLTGDATKELNPQSDIDTNPSYNDDYASFVDAPHSWFYRGGRAYDGSGAGVFAFYRNTGGVGLSLSSRSALWVME